MFSVDGVLTYELIVNKMSQIQWICWFRTCFESVEVASFISNKI